MSVTDADVGTLTAARIQMELSLGFHMIFAAVGVALPLMMLLAEGRWLRQGDPAALALAKTWAKATGLLFAIGAVSGTALSFELGLLWPRLMAFAGGMIGPAFALEGYAFFVEAIFLGLYLYGWQRLRPLAHWLCGVPVALSGAASSVLVVSANAWMQQPVGFSLVDGRVVNIDPVVRTVQPGLAADGAPLDHCLLQRRWLRRGRPVRRRSAERAPAGTSRLQPGGGRDRPAGRGGRRVDPAVQRRLARAPHSPGPTGQAGGLGGQFATERRAPLRIGGWPDPEARQTRGALEIPGLLSLLATESIDGEVVGLEAFPRDQWPNVTLVHVAFQLMVGSGFALLGLSAWYGWARWRGRRGLDWIGRRWLLQAVALAAPLGFLALETGWIVSEAGRQPWAIYGLLRTSDAVTPASEVTLSLATFTILYLLLAVTVVWLLRQLARSAES